MKETKVSIRECSSVWVVQKTFGKLTVEYRVPKETAATLDELKEFLKKKESWTETTNDKKETGARPPVLEL